MAEREALVTGCAGRIVHLRPLGSACSGCTDGCGGRCSLLPLDERGELALPTPAGFVPAVGERVRLRLDDAALRRVAFAGYGRALLGLLLGAGAGYGLARVAALPVDPLTLLGLIAGTWLAVRPSKSTGSELPGAAGVQILPGATDSFPSHTEDP